MKLKFVFFTITLLFFYFSLQASQPSRSMYIVPTPMHEPCCQLSLKCTCFPSVKRCCCISFDNKVRPHVITSRPKLIRYPGIAASEEVKSFDNPQQAVQEYLPE